MNRLLLQLLIAATLLAGCGGGQTERRMDERYTLKKGDEKPFGGSVFYQLLQQHFPYELEDHRLPFSHWYRETFQPMYDEDGDQKATYIIVAPATQAWEEEADDIHRFVASGNTVVLITDEMSEPLQTLLSLSLVTENDMMPFPGRYEEHTEGSRSLLQPGPNSTGQYSYFYTELRNRLSVTDRSGRVDTIGLNQYGRPDLLRYALGKGTLIVGTNARALSNYFLLSGNNLAFATRLIDYIAGDAGMVVWDNFYADNMYRREQDSSIFSAFFKNEALRWGFWIVIIATLLWLLMSLRRKERMIPEKAANTNDTVAFTETIANLYYTRNDHKNIAHKMIQHFTDTLRNRYFLPPNLSEKEYPAVVAAKTASDPEKTRQLFQLIHQIQASYEISEAMLMDLHFRIREVLQPTKTTA